MWIDPFSLRLSSPLQTAHGPISARRGFLVGLETDGSWGLGEATPLAGWTESHDACQEALAAYDSEIPATAPDPESTPAAAHAVESARLDARGRDENKPLAALLREAAFDTETKPLPATVPVNATIGDGTTAETVRAANTAVSAGYRCLKCKVGLQSVDDDLQRLRAVREAVGDSIELRVDANGAWTETKARQAVDGCARLGVSFIEQPLDATALEAHAALRGRGAGIALDESLRQYSVSEIVAAGAADRLVLKPMALGGPLQAIQTAAAAREAGVDPIVTTTIDAVVGRTAAVHVAAAIPTVAACGLATASLLESDLGADPTTIRDGKMSVPTEGGLCGAFFEPLQRY